MQHKAVYLLFCKFTVNVLGVNLTSYQEYTKLLPTWPSLATLEGGSYTKKYDQYRNLQLQFCVLLMTGVFEPETWRLNLQINK